MLKVSDIHFRYGDDAILNGISFDISSGDIMGLLGENGAGKSTLLNIISGVVFPESGSIEIDDRVRSLSARFTVYTREEETGTHQTSVDSDLIRRYVSYMPENFTLHPKRVTGEFIESRAGLFEVPEKVWKNLSGKAGLYDVWNMEMRKLSAGYRQRIGLVHTFMRDTPVVLLDEPFSGLDPGKILDFSDIIEEEAQKRSIIFSSHNLPQVYSLCSRITVLEKGKVIYSSRREDIKGKDELEQIFKKKLTEGSLE